MRPRRRQPRCLLTAAALLLVASRALARDQAPRDAQSEPLEEATPIRAPAPSVPAADGTGDTPRVRSIEATGKRPAREIEESPFPVTVIHGEDFAGRNVSLDQVLDRQAGVRVRQSGGVGSTSRISIRGLEGKRIKVYLDGRPLNTPDGSFGIDDLPLGLIDRIEIYKGVVPARFGGDGLGGAVNVVLKRRRYDYVDLSYGTASYGVHRGALLLRRSHEESGIEVGAGIIGIMANNDYLMPLPTGGSVRRDHDGYGKLLGGVALRLRKAWFDEIEIVIGAVRARKEMQGIPNSIAGGANQRNYQQAATTNQIYVLELGLEKQLVGPRIYLKNDLIVPLFRGGFRDTSPTVRDFEGNVTPSPSGSGEVGLGPNDAENTRNDVKNRLLVEKRLGGQHALTLNNVAAYSDDRPKDALADAHARRSVSRRPGRLMSSVTGLSHEWRSRADAFMSVVGLKHFAFSSRGELTNIYSDFNASPDIASQNRQAIGANAAIRQRLTPWLMVKASYEHGTRLPTAEELFGDGLIVQGSPALAPEISDNVVTGLHIDAPWTGGNRLRLDVDAFASRLSNLIVLGGIRTQNYANVDKASITGFELDAKLTLAGALGIWVNGTIQDVRNRTRFVTGTSQPNFLDGKRLPNTPWLFGNAGAELALDGLAGAWLAPSTSKVFYEVTAAAPYTYEYEVSRLQLRRLRGYVTHTAGIQQSLRDSRYVASFEVRNFTNVPPFDDFNAPLPGRTFALALRATYF